MVLKEVPLGLAPFTGALLRDCGAYLSYEHLTLKKGFVSNLLWLRDWHRVLRSLQLCCLGLEHLNAEVHVGVFQRVSAAEVSSFRGRLSFLLLCGLVVAFALGGLPCGFQTEVLPCCLGL